MQPFFPRKSVLLILLAVVLLAIAVRYPLVEHERYQSDSYFIHYLSKEIADSGQAEWILHPVSVFGYYPVSYPSAVPFLIAEFSVMSGFSVEVCILIYGVVLGTIFALVVFCLAREFMLRPQVAVLVALLATLAPRFVDTTYWDGSARGAGIVLMMLALLLALRANSVKRTQLFGLAFAVGAIAFAAHHMAILFVLFGIGYLLSLSAVHVVFPRIARKIGRAAMVYSIVAAGVIAIVVFSVFDFFGNLAELNLQKTAIFDISPPWLSILLNLAVTYTIQIGIIMPVAVLGIPHLLSGNHVSARKFYLMTLVLAFIPLLGNPLYISMVLAPFVAIIGAAWVAKLCDNPVRKKATSFAVVLLITSSILLTVWSIDRWNDESQPTGDTVEVGTAVFNDAAYLRVNGESWDAICNANVLSLQLASCSSTDFLRSGIPVILNGDISGEKISGNVTWSNAQFPLNLYVWFEYHDGPEVDRYVRNLMVYGIGFFDSSGYMKSETRDYFASHSKLLVVVDSNWPQSYVSVYDRPPSKLTVELQSASWSTIIGPSVTDHSLDCYAFYESERSTSYLLQLPV